jgi:glyoxylase-like metal-dependent hydrolase (beta-lactamase superfamily II)
MPGHQINVGKVELISLTDGTPTRSPLMPFPDTTLEQWREFPGLMISETEVQSRYGVLAIRSGGKLLIVDTGLQAPNGALMQDMKAKGVDPAAVDLVVFTHLHPDHVGWNLTNGKPNFPKARYLLPQKDWDYWSQPAVLAKAPHIANQVMPLKELRIMDLMGDNYNITDELTTVATPGHTPGHNSIVISSQGARGFILGDVAHSPAQAHYTDWSPIFDVDPQLSRQTRHRVLDQLEKEGTLVCAGHFPDPGFGRFIRGERRRYWQGV